MTGNEGEDFSSLDWPAGWLDLRSNRQECNALELELQRELAPGHKLFGATATILGRRAQRDDFLFQLDGSRVAQVHLTWQKETSRFFPDTSVFETFKAWAGTPEDDR